MNPRMISFSLPMIPGMSVHEFSQAIGMLSEALSTQEDMGLVFAEIQPAENRIDLILGFGAVECNWERMILGASGLCVHCNHPPDDHEKDKCTGCVRSAVS